MKIKIVKCHKEGLWYRYRIGEVFDVIESSVNPEFWVVVNRRILPCLRKAVIKSDCRPIKQGKRQTQAANKRKPEIVRCAYTKNCPFKLGGNCKLNYHCRYQRPTSAVR
jgi:hypothetical protein